MDAFTEAIARPATQSIVAKAMDEGFQQRSDLELNFGAYIAMTRQPSPPASRPRAAGPSKATRTRTRISRPPPEPRSTQTDGARVRSAHGSSSQPHAVAFAAGHACRS